MKIAVCGKGGCGKSTVSALLAKEFERMGKTVLVADSDESNYGLHRQLGVKLPRDFTEYFGGKEKAFKTMMVGEILDTVKLSAFAKKFYSEPFTLNEIPEEYISRNNGVMLISSGKIHQANEGCACTMNSILKQFIQHLTVGKNEVVLLDMEAGVEHFGRGVDNSVDLILMIVDPSFESLKLTKKIPFFHPFPVTAIFTSYYFLSFIASEFSLQAYEFLEFPSLVHLQAIPFLRFLYLLK